MKRFIPFLIVVALLATGCNKAQQGAGMGALAGATVGALTAGNKVTGAVIGAGIGLALGYIIGNEWDKYDQRQLSQTMENTPSGQTATWKNPDNGNYYEATPQPAYQQNDRVYRNVKLNAEIDGKQETVNAKAYRNPDGTWTLVQ